MPNMDWIRCGLYTLRPPKSLTEKWCKRRVTGFWSSQNWLTKNCTHKFSFSFQCVLFGGRSHLLWELLTDRSSPSCFLHRTVVPHWRKGPRASAVRGKSIDQDGPLSIDALTSSVTAPSRFLLQTRLKFASAQVWTWKWEVPCTGTRWMLFLCRNFPNWSFVAWLKKPLT